jgi:flagellar hook protein FlgE
MASFYIPLTGLNSDSTALNTIANNLANMSTTGFKSQSVNFSDLFYEQVGSSGAGNPIQVGAGTQVASIQTNFTNGSPTSNGITTDAALQGNGFFVVNNGGTIELTRAGNFGTNPNGNLVAQNGFEVMGFPALKGVVNTNAPLTAINIPVGQVEPPNATTNFSMTTTLDSSAAAGTTVPGTVQVYDSMGKSYQATVTYQKTGNNTWSYSISMPDTLTANPTTAAGVTTINYDLGSSGGTMATVNKGTNLTITAPATLGGTATTALPAFTGSPETVANYVTDLKAALTAAGITVGAGGVTVTSNAAGQLSISGAKISTSGNIVQDPIGTNVQGTLVFDANGNLSSPSSDVSGITFAGLSDAAQTMNLTWDLFGSSGAGTISQVDATSAVASTNQDGYASGQYQSFTIGSDGTVSATFSNGQKLAVGQLALGNVANLQGLQLLGDGDYGTTLASGTASIGTAGSSGLGSIQDGALEASNVNISAEFSNLIIAQRAFEANSKAITTFDTVTQETINMIH